MRLEDYTADAICRAMGLDGFIEPAWEQAENPTLRVVLTPSFHPELCITFTSTGDTAILSVVALAEQFWAQKSMVYLPTNQEQCAFSPEIFQEVQGLLREAHTAFNPERRYVCCDGMGSESCLVSRSETKRLCAHISQLEQADRFLRRLLDLAWESCHDPRVQNALAHGAWYLGIECPMREVPDREPVTRLAVLGTPQERQDLFDSLKSRKKDKG